MPGQMFPAAGAGRSRSKVAVAAMMGGRLQEFPFARQSIGRIILVTARPAHFLVVPRHDSRESASGRTIFAKATVGHSVATWPMTSEDGMKLVGKIALITGGSRGIGRATALA